MRGDSGGDPSRSGRVVWQHGGSGGGNVKRNYTHSFALYNLLSEDWLMMTRLTATFHVFHGIYSVAFVWTVRHDAWLMTCSSFKSNFTLYTDLITEKACCTFILSDFTEQRMANIDFHKHINYMLMNSK